MDSFWNNILKFGLIFLFLLAIIGVIVAVINRTQGWATIVLTIGLVIILSIIMYFVVSYLLKKLFGFDIKDMFSQIKSSDNTNVTNSVVSTESTDALKKLAVDTTISNMKDNMKEYCNVLNLLEQQQNWEEYSKLLKKYPNRKCA